MADTETTVLVAPYPPTDGTQPCRRTDPEIYFPDNTDKHLVRAAGQVCKRCPWLRECLAFALTHDVDGTWAGVSRGRRRKHQADRDITTGSVLMGAHSTTVEGRVRKDGVLAHPLDPDVVVDLALDELLAKVGGKP